MTTIRVSTPSVRPTSRITAQRLGASALMQGLADGYFVLPYTIGDYLSHKIQAPKVKTDTKAFDEAEKG